MSEYNVICWNCAQEFDALGVQWCGCSAVTPTKVCPFCYSCMCQAPESYLNTFWEQAPEELLAEKKSFNQPRDKLGDLLVKQNLLTNDQLLVALKKQKETGDKLGSLLVKLGFVDDATISQALSQQFGLMTLDLEKAEIDDDLIDEIGIDLIEKYKIIPIEKQELTAKKMITVAVSNPLTPEGLESLQRTLGYTIYPVLAQDNVFDNLFTKLINRESEDVKKSKDIQLTKAKINQLLADAIKRKASDILIEPEHKELMISLRIGGKLFKTPSPPIHLSNFIRKRLKKLAKIDDVKNYDSALGIDGRFRVKARERYFDFLLHAFYSPSGECLNIKVIDDTLYAQKLSKLVLDPVTLKIITDIPTAKKGLVYLIGPVGSGRKMTLYSILRNIGETNRTIVSIESPVISNIPNVIQKEFNPQKKHVLLDKINKAMEKYPDILVIPEIEDRETADRVFEIAQDTLVISLFNSLTTSELLTYLTGLKVSKSNLELINAVINQRLLPSLCSNCREEVELDQTDIVRLGLKPSIDLKGFRSIGCQNCFGSGYSGFAPLVEVCVFDSPFIETLHSQQSFSWIDTYPGPTKARSIRRLVTDLLSKGWITADDSLNLGLDELTADQEPRTLKRSHTQDGETDIVSLS